MYTKIHDIISYVNQDTEKSSAICQNAVKGRLKLCGFSTVSCSVYITSILVKL